MASERYPRNSNPGDHYGQNDQQDYGQDYGSGRDYSYSSAREYQAAGRFGGERDQRDNDRNREDRGRDEDRGAYGSRNYASQDQGSQSYGARGSGAGDYGPREYGYGRYAQRDRFGAGGPGQDRQRSYGSAEHGNNGRQGRQSGEDHDYGRQPQGYDYRERGFFDRAGDEVRSWFGDQDAESRRERDARYDAQGYGRDDDYGNWRRQQVDALDRDYHEYRQENRSKFANEFGSWRTERQGQRSSLQQVTEHMDVIGSDGEHVGTVDKVHGDRIILTKSDNDAGGRHHSIPSRWIQTVEDKVTLRKTASEAQSHWKDEENNQALFNEGDRKDSGQFNSDHNLNRSFSGTYRGE